MSREYEPSPDLDLRPADHHRAIEGVDTSTLADHEGAMLFEAAEIFRANRRFEDAIRRGEDAAMKLDYATTAGEYARLRVIVDDARVEAGRAKHAAQIAEDRYAKARKAARAV